MISGPTANMTILGSGLLLAVAALNASGYPEVADAVALSNLPDSMKEILPALFLYPPVLMVISAFAAPLSLRHPLAAPFVLGVIATIIAANAVFGLILGGVFDGAVLLLAAALLTLAAYNVKQGEESD